MFRSILAAYREAFSGLNRAVWLLALTTLVNRSGTMVLPFLILYLTQQRGFEPTDAGKALGIYGLGGVLGSYLVCRLLLEKKKRAARGARGAAAARLSDDDGREGP